MGLILNLETATTNCSVCIARDGKVLLLKEDNSPQYSHAEQLHNFIQEAVEKTGNVMSDLDAIAVSKGPGSYTGLRIGVSAAKGLCFALDIPLIAIPTLESMAHQINTRTGEKIIPLLDARRMEVYSSVYDSDYKEIRETRAEVIDGSSFESYKDEKKIWLIGSGSAKCQEVLEYPNFNYKPEIIPSAREMAILSHLKFKENKFEDVAYFEPYYLKDFMVLQKKPKS